LVQFSSPGIVSSRRKRAGLPEPNPNHYLAPEHGLGPDLARASMRACGGTERSVNTRRSARGVRGKRRGAGVGGGGGGGKKIKRIFSIKTFSDSPPSTPLHPLPT